MARAVKLAEKGFPAPNPRVGCVLVKDGHIVGEGYHAAAGGPHAEVHALSSAGHLARGSTAYVTLEPCNGTGRTGPCTHALIAAGVREVFYAVADPNPKMSGGAMTLEKAGITVHTSLLENPAREVNRLWLEAQRLGRPYVIAKAAMSLDGRIALLSGESKWITDERARSAGHRLRAECGCVLVGRNTVSIDDPELTARIPGVQNPPLRVVVDRDATLQGSERMFNEAAPSLRLTSRPSLAQDIELVDFSCRSILGLLWTRGVTSVLIEGGAKTTTSFLKAGLVDRLELFVAPKALGNGPSWFEGHLESISLAPEFHFDRVRKVGPDLQITAYPVRSETSL